MCYQRVKPHKKKKLRTLATDLTSSSEYDKYVAQLDTLPQLDVAEPIRAPVAAPLVSRRDSSEDEAMVSKLSSNVPAADSSKAKSAGMCV